MESIYLHNCITKIITFARLITFLYCFLIRFKTKQIVIDNAIRRMKLVDSVNATLINALLIMKRNTILTERVELL